MKEKRKIKRYKKGYQKIPEDIDEIKAMEELSVEALVEGYKDIAAEDKKVNDE